jgi:hypothetical protein
MLKYNGCWQLLDKLGNPVNLYTKKAVAFAKNVTTGQEYRRGEYKLFFSNGKEKFPSLIEDTGGYEFYYINSEHPGTFDLETCAKELLVTETFKK